MAKYVIHACLKREWYVKQYLIPSMIKQGIKSENISVWQDSESKGNLQACMECFDSMPEEGNTWHLQDDVLISSKFKEVTEQYNDFNGIVCGISIKHDIENDAEKWNKPIIGIDYLWWSFPCIMIPNKIARDTAYYYKYVPDKNTEYWKKYKKGDDSVFRTFLQKYHPLIEFINLVPNIVAHVDYLLGGTTINDQREYILYATHFEEPQLVEELKEALNDGKHRSDKPKRKRRKSV